jgi:hypothetical protein
MTLRSLEEQVDPVADASQRLWVSEIVEHGMSDAKMDRQPDFIVIGAMKCATTTLHEQLSRQPGVFMSRPKEPNFFSDDDNYAHGPGWYSELFSNAPPGAHCGESSTHYTKRPTHPETVDRMSRALPKVKLIYVMRHPIDRLLSHYLHERTNGTITEGIHEAIDVVPGLIDYGRYSMQLEPYLEAYGTSAVLPVFFSRLVDRPQDELDRIGRFLGLPARPLWDATLKPQNVGSERLRSSVLREALVRAPVLTTIRRRLIPRHWTEPVKTLWRARGEAPQLSPGLQTRLREAFDPDLERLGNWLGVRLDCGSFREATRAYPYDWVIRR